MCSSDLAEDGSVDNYLDKLKKHDWYFRMSDDPRTYDRGRAEIDNLKKLYAGLSDMDKQKALHGYLELAATYYPEKDYPDFAKTIRTLTTQSFGGMY